MIKLIVLDIDGCLTDGGIIYASDGSETKKFSVKDGLAISSWSRLGFHVAIITGRESQVVERRAKELKIAHLFQGIEDKEKVLDTLVHSLGLSYSEVAAIGDDFNDFRMLQKAGRSFTPKDGVKEIQKIVHTVLSSNGGDGAVREMIDILIDENGLREKFLDLWL